MIIISPAYSVFFSHSHRRRDALPEQRHTPPIHLFRRDAKHLDELLSQTEAPSLLDRIKTLSQERKAYLASIEGVFVEQETWQERSVSEYEERLDYDGATTICANHAQNLWVRKEEQILIDYWTSRAELNRRRDIISRNILYEQTQGIKQRFLQGVS